MAKEKQARWWMGAVSGTVNGVRMCRSELWQRPFDGQLVAYTTWRTTKAQAVKDGRKYLREPHPTEAGRR
jgi:hypothetical protein